MDNYELECYKKAGRIASQALNLGISKIKEGESITKILDEVESHILRSGAEIAFPAQISINNVAAHQCSIDEDEKIPKGIIKLDVGAAVDGFIGDNAKSVAIGTESKVIDASRAALNNALKLVRPGVKIGEIGREIESTIKKAGFLPIKNLSGHGLGKYQIHKAPSIPNYDSGDETELKEGDVIAIEPFASTEDQLVSNQGLPTVFSLIPKSKQPRGNMTRQVLKTIKTYKGLPFTTRWLIKIHGVGTTNFALRELKQLGMLEEHPPLAVPNGYVSQSEHTVIVKNKPIITTESGE